MFLYVCNLRKPNCLVLQRRCGRLVQHGSYSSLGAQVFPKEFQQRAFDLLILLKITLLRLLLPLLPPISLLALYVVRLWLVLRPYNILDFLKYKTLSQLTDWRRRQCNFVNLFHFQCRWKQNPALNMLSCM